MAKINSIGSPFPSRHPSHSKSKMDTVIIEMRTVAGWRIPSFQRQLRVTEKVRDIAEIIKAHGGVIPGVLTIGVLRGSRDAGEFLIDGQHRVEAFRLSECSEAIADVRFVEFDSMASMGEEFVRLNSQIVKLRPDDVLRGLEESTPTLRTIRERCPFIGYDYVRRGPTSALLSMSAVLKVWEGSAAPTPISSGKSAVHLAAEVSDESIAKMCIFLSLAYEAWKLDESSKRLWSALNMGICMWLWRRLVDETSRTSNRYIVLKNDQFKRCLMSLAAAESYTDWLLGRAMGDRDRAPCYLRVRQIFTRRLLEDKVSSKSSGKITLPAPAWAKL